MNGQPMPTGPSLDLKRYNDLRGTDTFKISTIVNPNVAPGLKPQVKCTLIFKQFDQYTGAESDVVIDVNLEQTIAQHAQLVEQRDKLSEIIQQLSNLINDCVKATKALDVSQIPDPVIPVLDKVKK